MRWGKMKNWMMRLIMAVLMLATVQASDAQTETEGSDGTWDEYTLEPVIQKARRVKKTEKAVTVKEITVEDIDMRSDKVLKDVLFQMPGIQVSTQRKGTTEFTLRGYDMSKVAILVDDIPLIDSFSGSMDIDNIGLMDISEIVVSRGTTSALYGTRGGVGAVNLIRKEPTELYATASIELGEYGNTVASVSHGAAVGKGYYYLSALHDVSNGYKISGKLDRSEREEWLKTLSRYDLYGFTLEEVYSASCAAKYYLNDTGLWDHTEHDKYKLNGKVGYHFSPELEVGVSAFYNNTEMEKSTYFTDMRSMYTYSSLTKEKDWRLPNNSYILRNLSSLWPEYDDYAVSPFVNFEKGGFSLKANAYRYELTNTFLAYDDPLEDILAYNRDKDTMTWSIWASSTSGLNIYPSFRLSSWDRLNLALANYVSDHTEEEQAYNEASTQIIQYYGYEKVEELNIEAAYLTVAVENEMEIGEDLELTLGVSYDGQDLRQYQKKLEISGSREMIDQYLAADDAALWGTRDAFNPVASLIYEPMKNFLTLRASASRKISFPSLRAYSKTVSPYQDSSDLGSRDVMIEPEKMLNGNVGFELSLFNNRVTWGTDYFFSRYDDKITKIYITKSDDYIYRNIDSAVIHGAETTVNTTIPDLLDLADISLSSTYTYTFSENQADVENSFINKGSRFEYLPEHKITFDLRTNFKTDTSLVVFGTFEFNQIQYVMASVPYTKYDFSTAYFYAQKLHDPIKIDVKLSQKIFWRYDYDVYVMCKNILDDYNADPFNPGAGRTWYAGFKASF